MLCSQNYGQGLCPIINVKVNKIRGKVLSNDKLQEPIKQTKVELISFGETESVVTSTLTDDSGYFEINNIKKGKYALEAWLTVNGEPYFKYRLTPTVKKLIYQAATLEEADHQLDAFSDKWSATYPIIVKSWRNNWVRIIPMFSFAHEIRRAIYTTNTIESLNITLRKIIKNR